MRDGVGEEERVGVEAARGREKGGVAVLQVPGCNSDAKEAPELRVG